MSPQASHNAEQYLKEWAVANGVHIRSVPFGWLPAVDAAVSADTGTVCIKKMYSCLRTLQPHHPQWCVFHCDNRTLRDAEEHRLCVRHMRASPGVG